MKFIFFILIFLSLKCYSQAAKWTTNNELGVVSYEVQISPDQNTWSSLITVQPTKLKDSNSYSYSIPATQSFFRIKANMLGNTYYTNAILLNISTVKNSVTITNAAIKSVWFFDNLTWTTRNESNVDYYHIDKTTDNKNYTEVCCVDAKGNSNYSCSNFRFFTKKPTYRVTPHFKDGKTGSPVIFK